MMTYKKMNKQVESGGYLPSVILGAWELPAGNAMSDGVVLWEYGFSGAEEVFMVYRECMDRMKREGA